MASGVKLVLKFEDSNGKDVIFSFPYANPSASRTQVKALMNGIITNGSIFEHVPVEKKSAKLVTTTQTAVDVDD